MWNFCTRGQRTCKGNGHRWAITLVGFCILLTQMHTTCGASKNPSDSHSDNHHGHNLHENHAAEKGNSHHHQHDDDDHDSEHSELAKVLKNASIAVSDKQYFIKRLFEKYGNGGVITFEGFEHLLQNLGLGKLKIEDHDIHDHHMEKGGFKNFHPSHNHTKVDENKNGTSTTTKKKNRKRKKKPNKRKKRSTTLEYVVTTPSGLSIDSAVSEHYKTLPVNHDSEEVHPTEAPDHHHQSQQPHPHRHRKTPHHHRHHGQNHPGHPETTDGEIHRDNMLPEHQTPLIKSTLNDRMGEGMEPSQLHQRKKREADTHGDHGDHKHHDDDHNHVHTHSPVDDDDHHDNVSFPKELFLKPAAAVIKQRWLSWDLMQCLSPSEILATYQIHYENGINTNQFVQLCPAIIYQLDAQSCSPRPPPDHFHTDDEGDHLKYFHGDHDHHDHGHGNGTGVTFKPAWQFWEIPLKVWGYAVLSVTIISLVGLLGVAIVPIMQKVFYNHLLQFLVALAVGSLTGDALLHLIPHSLAIAEENHSHDEEGGGHSTEGVYRGLVILSGIYFFFITERLMTIIGDMRRKRKSNKKTKRKMQRKIFSDLDSSVGSRLSRHNELYHSCEEFVIMMNGSRVVHDMGEDGRIEKYQEFQMSRINEEDEANETTQMTEEVAPSQGHSHGGHGHSHHGGKVPGTVAAVAWMVIMGDGLHNFSDGLAIGAAFANSITGGLSTSVAVFCHELPHELGDFAVLLKAGMSVKQALVYNIISSVLCFVGMLIGVAVGNMSSASLWIFALAGGMFIYIALVDMLPEMNADHSENPLCLLLLQNIGMAVGITIMLLIALFEGDIKIDVEL